MFIGVRHLAALLVLTLAAALLTVAPSNASAPPSNPTASDEAIARWIAQLADPAFDKREQAEAELTRLGPAVVTVLRKVSREHEALEVRHRARRAWHRIARLPPDELRLLQRAAEDAFKRGAWRDAVASYAKLAVQVDATFEAHITLGHVHYLAHQFDEAVAAYRIALEQIDHTLARHLGTREEGDDDAPDAAADEAQDDDPDDAGRYVITGDVIEALERVDRRVQATVARLFEQRWALAQLIARIERGELNDPQAAVATVSQALMWPGVWHRSVPELVEHRREILEKYAARTIDVAAHTQRGRHMRRVLYLLHEAAAAHEQRGDLDAAIDTLSRIALLRVTYGLLPPEDETHTLATLLERRWQEQADGNAEMTPPPTLLTLRPDEAERTFVFDDPALLASTHGYTYVGPSHPNALLLGFVPPPGWDFDTVQVQPLDATTVMPHAWAHARGDMPLTVSLRNRGDGTYTVPPGTNLVRIRLQPGTPSGMRIEGPQRFIVRATFKERIDIGAVAEHPQWSPRPAQRADARQDANALFESHETNLASMRRMDGPNVPPFAQIAPLSDGRWLLAFSAGMRHQRLVMIALSDDLKTWSPPIPLPVMQTFPMDAPALGVDAEGNVWLAFISQPVDALLAVAGGGHPPHVWLTSTRDGRTWTTPRGIAGPRFNSPSPRPVQLLHNPADGRCWMFTGSWAASAPNFAELTSLNRNDALPHEQELPCFTIDRSGVFHAIHLDRRGALYYQRSHDGTVWTDRVPVFADNVRRDISDAQLLVHGDRLALMYHEAGRDVLRLGAWRDRAPHLDAEQHLIATTARTSLHGSRIHLTAEGELIVLTGADTPQLLRSDVLKQP